ncbi:MAG: hypothetical protein EAZ62_09525 [Sphingobacteriia bacterium]|nr:MAG: hypothetical protein EAZ62_09525 [Sphingobacteriia bacterium]
MFKEVLHKSDVEELIGKRPFEEKKLLEIEAEAAAQPTASNDPIQAPPTPTEQVAAAAENESVPGEPVAPKATGEKDPDQQGA